MKYVLRSTQSKLSRGASLVSDELINKTLCLGDTTIVIWSGPTDIWRNITY